jgi:IS30 family transposase
VSRRRKAKPRILPETWALIEDLIRRDWSPEQVSGRLESEYNIRVSHEWIYQHILADKRVGGDLYRHLRCQPALAASPGKRRRKRFGSYDRRGILPNRVSIDERPEVVDSRERLGDWEVDTIMVAHCATIIGKGRQPALVTLIERKSRLTLLRKVERKTAEAVAAAVTLW